MQTTTSRLASGEDQPEPMFRLKLTDQPDQNIGALFGVTADMPADEQPVGTGDSASNDGPHWPADITLEDAYVRGFGRLRAIIEQYLDGITTREYLAERYEQILAAVAVYEQSAAR